MRNYFEILDDVLTARPDCIPAPLGDELIDAWERQLHLEATFFNCFEFDIGKIKDPVHLLDAGRQLDAAGACELAIGAYMLSALAGHNLARFHIACALFTYADREIRDDRRVRTIKRQIEGHSAFTITRLRETRLRARRNRRLALRWLMSFSDDAELALISR